MNRCPQLFAPANGSLYPCSNLSGQTCIFSCDNGYNLIGSRTRRCNSNGTWTGTPTQCNGEEGRLPLTICTCMNNLSINLTKRTVSMLVCCTKLQDLENERPGFTPFAFKVKIFLKRKSCRLTDEQIDRQTDRNRSRQKDSQTFTVTQPVRASIIGSSIVHLYLLIIDNDLPSLLIFC